MAVLDTLKRFTKHALLHADEYETRSWRYIVQTGLRAKNHYEGKFVVQASLERIQSWAHALKPFVEAGKIPQLKYTHRENEPGDFFGEGSVLIVYARESERDATESLLKSIGIPKLRWMQDELETNAYEYKRRIHEHAIYRGELRQTVLVLIRILDHCIGDAIGSTHFVIRDEYSIENERAVVLLHTNPLGSNAPKGPLFIARLFADVKDKHILIGQPVLRFQYFAPEYHDVILAAILEKRTFLEEHADVTFSVH